MIDEIIVKNSDDILILKKTKDKNSDAIKLLEARIDALDKEIKRTIEALKDKKVKDIKDMKQEESADTMECEMCAKSFERFVDLERNPYQDQP